MAERLDVGCGAGRIALHLHERGHEVIAIDNSPLAVEVARRRGVVTDSVDPRRHEDPAFRKYGRRAQRFRVRYHEYATPWFRYLMVSPLELERLVVGTGWRLLRVLEDDSPRFLAVLEQTGS